MLTTEFLARDQFSKYGSWLKNQDSQTLYDYFGCVTGQKVIDSLVQGFIGHPNNHHFLIAKVNGQWAGTIHIATHTQEVEFGVIVALLHRRQGIANIMIDQAITWARNRFYTDLYMHCIESNRAIKRLCQKHDLKVRNMMGDSEADLVLLPPTPLTFLKEQLTTQYNLLAKFFPYQYSHQ